MKILSLVVLAAALAHVAPAFAQVPQEDAATPALKKEFNGFIARFRAALKADDSAAVASMTRLPLGYDDSIRDAAQFSAVAYPRDFPASDRACIQHSEAFYDRDGFNNENFFIFCGELIFAFTKTPAGFLFTDIGMND